MEGERLYTIRSRKHHTPQLCRKLKRFAERCSGWRFCYRPWVDEASATAVKQRSEVIRRESRTGLAYGLSAFVMWGFIAVYFRAVSHVPASIVLCHRVVWSALFIGLVVSIRREWAPVLAALRTRRHLMLLASGALLIGLNCYAVASRQLLQASLGYFINPLLSIALGMLFLKERLRVLQWVAVAIAGIAVANLAIRATGFPWIALLLAGSFGFYGLVRKKVDINSLHGLLIETLVLAPFASAALLLLPAPDNSAGTLGLLSLSGIITAVPLLCFGAALRRLRLSTMGFLQYVGPTLQFLVAIWLFHEALDPVKLASFALCWVAIAVYLGDSLWRQYPPPVADQPE
jgi:chloramphenicol-sensitive protein RarD